MVAIVEEIVSGLTSGITGMAEGIGSGLQELVSNVFLTLSETGEITGLSTTGVVVIAFAGVALAVGLSKFVVKWVMSLGARK